MNSVSTDKALAALASFLIVIALMGHSVYHALDVHHAHHVHHESQHQQDKSQSDDSQPNGLTAEVRDLSKCELFSLILPDAVGYVPIQRTFAVITFRREDSWGRGQVPLGFRSRGPPRKHV